MAKPAAARKPQPAIGPSESINQDSAGTSVVSSKELVETAFRVLAEWAGGGSPAPADVAVLRAALPEPAGLDVDELACRVIHEAGGALRELRQDRTSAGGA